MAHTIVAADLGGSAIKLARFEASFRRLALLDTRVLPSSAVGKPEERLVAQLAVLKQHLDAERLDAEELLVGLPGDALSFRVVDLPFSNPKQIESVLSYELESQLLTPVDEMVLDFVVLGPARGLGAGGSETRVLVAAAPKALVGAVVKAAAELGLPLRNLCATPLGYTALLDEALTAPALRAPAAPVPAPIDGGEASGVPGLDDLSDLGDEAVATAPRPPIHLVLDLGAEHTTVLLVRGEVPLMARTIARGGRHLTDAVAAAFQLEPAAAEQAKREAGFVAHQGTPRMSPSQAHMDTAIRRALAPLVRELLQTLAAFRATYGEGVDRVLLTGGGGRLAGLCEHLAEELGVEATPLPWAARPGLPAIAPDQADLLACALGMALGGQHPATQVNFRKGEFAYRSDYSFIRGKALHLAVAAALIVVFTGLNGYVNYRGLRKEHELLAVRLKKATLEVFGKERDDLARISEELKKGDDKASAQVPIPSYSAFDLVEEMSRLAPPADKIHLDVEELDIKPKKVAIKGTTETAQQVDDLADALRKVECFEEVQKGKLVKRTVTPPTIAADSVTPAARDKDKPKPPTELTQFTLTIKGTCP